MSGSEPPTPQDAKEKKSEEEQQKAKQSVLGDKSPVCDPSGSVRESFIRRSSDASVLEPEDAMAQRTAAEVEHQEAKQSALEAKSQEGGSSGSAKRRRKENDGAIPEGDEKKKKKKRRTSSDEVAPKHSAASIAPGDKDCTQLVRFHKAFRNCLRHFAKRCLPKSEQKRKAEYHRIIQGFCKNKLPHYDKVGSDHWSICAAHEKYWERIEKTKTKKRLADLCQLFFNNRAEGQDWQVWCLCLTLCFLEPANKLLSAEECADLKLSNHDSCGALHENMLMEAMRKYMGGSELASYIYENGVPQLLAEKHNRGDEVLLIEFLEWWVMFLRGIAQEDDAQRQNTEKKTALEAQPLDGDKENGYRRSPVTIPAKKERTTPFTIATPCPQPDWRHGQHGRWIWVENSNAHHR